MTAQRYTLIVGLVLIGIGVALGLLIPLAVTGDIGSQTCGAPWTGSGPITGNAIYGSHATDYRSLCNDARGSRGTIAIVLVGAGAVITGASFIRRTAPVAA